MKTVPAVAEIWSCSWIEFTLLSNSRLQGQKCQEIQVFIYCPILEYHKNNADFWANSSQAWLRKTHNTHHQASVAQNFLKLWHLRVVFTRGILVIFAGLRICPWYNLQFAFSKRSLVVKFVHLISSCLRAIIKRALLKTGQSMIHVNRKEIKFISM